MRCASYPNEPQEVAHAAYSHYLRQKRQLRALKTQVSAILTTYADSALVEVTTQQLDQLTSEGYSLEVLENINEINVGGELVDTSIAPLAVDKAAPGVRGVLRADDFPH